MYDIIIDLFFMIVVNIKRQDIKLNFPVFIDSSAREYHRSETTGDLYDVT